MLLNIQQFILKSAIKAPIYILNPYVIKEEEIKLPRLSVLHYLDNNFDNHFPTRDLVYFSNILKSKKLPIYHITDLITKEETTTLLNKTIGQEVRKWSQNNIKDFRNTNLLEIPNKDVNLIAIYNYNLLKDLYKYKTSLISSYYKFYNLYSTYWHYVKEAISKDTDSYHFVKIELPNTIPNYNLINVILKFNPIKYTRIINDNKLAQVIDLYKWLLNSTRNSCTLKNISDEDSKRIIIEFSYKGYSAFLPLYIIRSMCKESTLENKVKVTDNKIQKLFIIMLYKIQNKINSALELLEESIDKPIVDQIPEEQAEEIKHEDDNEISDFDITHDSDNLDNFPTIDSSIQEVTSSKKKVNTLLSQDKIDTNISESIDTNINALNQLLDNEINNIEDSEVDQIFEETILQIENEKEDENLPILNINKDSAHINKILTNKSLDDKFDLYIKEVSEFKLLTAQELRTLRKTFENRQLLKSPYNSNINLNIDKQIIKRFFISRYK